MEDGIYYTTGEFSEITGVSKRTLQYYDKIGILPPEFKDISGYRYYSYIQFITLDFIQRFKNLKFSLKEINSIFTELNVTDIQKLLFKKEKEIQKEIDNLTKQKKVIQDFQLFTSNLNSINVSFDKIELRKFSERYALFVSKETSTFKMDEALKLYRFLIELEKGYNPWGWYFGIYHNYFDKTEKPIIIDFCRQVEKVDNNGHVKKIPAGLYATVSYKGIHKETLEHYEDLKSWISSNNYKIIGPPLIYFINIIFPNKKFTSIDCQIRQMQIPITK